MKEYKHFQLKKKLKSLRKYIKILKQDSKNNLLEISFFTLLHNYLILEYRFYPVVYQANKELAKNLPLLPDLQTIMEIKGQFILLYDKDSNLLNNIETFDSIEEIRIILKAFQKAIYYKTLPEQFYYDIPNYA